jgi:hypothetical protein
MMAAACSCSRTISVKEVSSAASVLTVIWPMSSSGKKPLGMAMNRTTVATKVSSATTSTVRRCASAMSRLRVYQRSMATKARSNARTRSPGGFLWASSVRNRLAIIGTRVSETTAEIRIVIASVTANSRNRRPTTSLMNSSGISTAISDTVSEMIVKPICVAPLNAASIGFSPASM